MFFSSGEKYFFPSVQPTGLVGSVSGEKILDNAGIS